jgi:hypothetical protein
MDLVEGFPDEFRRYLAVLICINFAVSYFFERVIVARFAIYWEKREELHWKMEQERNIQRLDTLANHVIN